MRRIQRMNKEIIGRSIESLRGLKQLFVRNTVSGSEDNILLLDTAVKALEDKLAEDWIPVDRELPTSDGRFEVTLKGSKGKRHVEMCDFHKDAKAGKWGSYYYPMNVIAWRKRPEPYKEENHE
jgi:hypothetical protein